MQVRLYNTLKKNAINNTAPAYYKYCILKSQSVCVMWNEVKTGLVTGSNSLVTGSNSLVTVKEGKCNLETVRYNRERERERERERDKG